MAKLLNFLGIFSRENLQFKVQTVFRVHWLSEPTFNHALISQAIFPGSKTTHFKQIAEVSGEEASPAVGWVN